MKYEYGRKHIIKTLREREQYFRGLGSVPVSAGDWLTCFGMADGIAIALSMLEAVEQDD